MKNAGKILIAMIMFFSISNLFSFIYNISDKSLLPYTLQQIEKPECIIYDNNKLYMTNYWEEAQIIVFDLVSWSEEARYDFNNYKYFDGITKDNDGNLYVACWGDMMISEGIGKILKCSMNDINNLTEFRSGFSAPSDIYFNSAKNELAIPNYTGNSVDFIPLVENVYENGNILNDFAVYQIKDELIINSKSSEKIDIITLYNLYGQKIYNNNILGGNTEIHIPVNDLVNGLYFIGINNNISKLLINK
ncbi:MAG: hypothetical protein HZB41_13100 [Ignavibacteriae bacterium]|nr:hypothetical protein [Ignavibacteriota bacterium]